MTDTSKVSSMDDLLKNTTSSSTTTTYDPVLDAQITTQQYLAKFGDLAGYESTYEERTSSLVSGVHFNTKREEQVYLNQGYEEITSDVQNELINGNKVRNKATKAIVDRPVAIISLDTKKANLLVKINNYTATSITDGFKFDVTANDDTTKAIFDCSEEDQLTFNAAYAASLSSDFATNTTYNGKIPMRGRAVSTTGVIATSKTIYYFDAATMQRFMNTLGIHIGTCKQTGWSLQNDANNATEATWDEVEKAILAVINSTSV